MLFYTTSLFMSISVDINNQFDIYIYVIMYIYIYIVMPFLYGSVWFHDKKKKPSAEKMMRKTHGIWRWGIPLDKVKNCGTWKISTLKNIYRKTGNIYSISSQISFYHISTPYFFLQYIHWNIIEIIYSYSFIHISTVYLQYIYLSTFTQHH